MHVGSHTLLAQTFEDIMCAFNSRHSPTDPFNLERFVHAQDRVYQRVLSELRAGQKMSHWMWFIFPQVWDLALRNARNCFCKSRIVPLLRSLENRMTSSSVHP